MTDEQIHCAMTVAARYAELSKAIEHATDAVRDVIKLSMSNDMNEKMYKFLDYMSKQEKLYTYRDAVDAYKKMQK